MKTGAKLSVADVPCRPKTHLIDVCRALPRADLVEALKVLEAQVESLKAKGNDQGAAETIKEFFAANAGLKKHFKAARRSDSLLDPPDE